MDLLLADFRHSFRVLGRNLGFTLAAVLALALGIGANTAIFSLVSAVLLKPLPYARPQDLVVVLHGGNSPVSPADFLDWRAQSTSFQQLGAAQAWGGILSGFDHPQMTPGLQMSGNMFGLLGVSAFRGRTITPQDALPGAEPVIVLSFALWRDKLGAGEAILGRTLLVDGKRYTVVGIMPEGFQFAPFWMTKAAMWTQLILEPRRLDRGGRSLRVFGRLKDGATSEPHRRRSTGSAPVWPRSIRRRMQNSPPPFSRYRKKSSVRCVPPSSRCSARLASFY